MTKNISDNRKTVSYWIDKNTIEKFDKFLSQFTGVSKQEVIEYLMDSCANTKPDSFIQAFKIYLTSKVDREIGFKSEEKEKDFFKPRKRAG